jgi:hypothetical protein
MRDIESIAGRRRVGDGGRSLGEYHITRMYWTDATRFGGVRWDYATDVWDAARCQQVMIWYWQRWCPEAFARVRDGRGSLRDLETLARVHNGGPRGAGKPSTLRHWRRVRDALTD